MASEREGALQVALSQPFVRMVEKLVSDGSRLIEAYAELTKRQLDFAERLFQLQQDALRRDGKKGGVHQRELNKGLKQLGDKYRISVRSSSEVSQWTTIAKRADDLRKLDAEKLPSSKGALYALAKKVEDDTDLKAYIRSGELTPESTINDIKRLGRRAPKKRAAAGRKSTVAEPSVEILAKQYLSKNLAHAVTLKLVRGELDLPSAEDAFVGGLSVVVFQNRIDPQTQAQQGLLALGFVTDKELLKKIFSA